MKPFFSHRGLSIRFVEESDLNLVRALRNDETTWMNLTDPRPLSPSDQQAWFGSIGARSGKFYFVAFNADIPFIGLVRMDEYDTIQRSIRVGADVAPNLRGRGHGGRIYDTIKAYCFDQLGLHRVHLEVLATNPAERLYQRKGFKLEGRKRHAVFRNGCYVDYLLYSILETEYRTETVE